MLRSSAALPRKIAQRVRRIGELGIFEGIRSRCVVKGAGVGRVAVRVLSIPVIAQGNIVGTRGESDRKVSRRAD